jgi:hypothetical protein
MGNLPGFAWCQLLNFGWAGAGWHGVIMHTMHDWSTGICASSIICLTCVEILGKRKPRRDDPTGAGKTRAKGSLKKFHLAKNGLFRK